MPSIPIHDLERKSSSLEFEVVPWKKDISKYDTGLPHRHSYYEILVFLKGGGKHEIDFQNYPIKSHSLHFVAANQVHEVKRTPASDGYSILFTSAFLPEQYAPQEFEFYQTGADPVLNLSKETFKEVKFLLDELRKEFDDDSIRKREVLQSLMQMILLKSQRLYAGNLSAAKVKPSAEAQQFMIPFSKLVDAHFHEHWRAGDYAKAMNMSVANLNTLCKQHFSRSTESIIQDRVIVEIKRLLCYTNKTVKEICYDLNFEDPAYFTRFFKKKTGITPLEYRNAVN